MIENTRSVRHRDSDRLGMISWAMILIWAGLVFLADNTGYLNSITLPSIFATGRPVEGDFFSLIQPNAWTLVFLGAGVIVLLEGILQILVPGMVKYRIPGNLIFGMILIGIGLSGFIRWEILWSFILIGIGLSVLLGGFIRR